jgi:hypothetical protein
MEDLVREGQVVEQKLHAIAQSLGVVGTPVDEWPASAQRAAEDVYKAHYGIKGRPIFGLTWIYQGILHAIGINGISYKYKTFLTYLFNSTAVDCRDAAFQGFLQNVKKLQQLPAKLASRFVEWANQQWARLKQTSGLEKKPKNSVPTSQRRMRGGDLKLLLSWFDEISACWERRVDVMDVVHNVLAQLLLDTYTLALQEELKKDEADDYFSKFESCCYGYLVGHLLFLRDRDAPPTVYHIADMAASARMLFEKTGRFVLGAVNEQAIERHNKDMKAAYRNNSNRSSSDAKQVLDRKLAEVVGPPLEWESRQKRQYDATNRPAKDVPRHRSRFPSLLDPAPTVDEMARLEGEARLAQLVLASLRARRVQPELQRELGINEKGEKAPATPPQKAKRRRAMAATKGNAFHDYVKQ